MKSWMTGGIRDLSLLLGKKKILIYDGTLLSVSDIIDIFLLFSIHHLPRQILITLFLLRSEESLQLGPGVE